MKTVKIQLDGIKRSDEWYELLSDLQFESWEESCPECDEDELHDRFYDYVTSVFEQGEIANLELEIDENLNIIAGRIIPYIKIK